MQLHRVAGHLGRTNDSKLAGIWSGVDGESVSSDINGSTIHVTERLVLQEACHRSADEVDEDQAKGRCCRSLTRAVDGVDTCVTEQVHQAYPKDRTGRKGNAGATSHAVPDEAQDIGHERAGYEEQEDDVDRLEHADVDLLSEQSSVGAANGRQGDHQGQELRHVEVGRVHGDGADAANRSDDVVGVLLEVAGHVVSSSVK